MSLRIMHVSDTHGKFPVLKGYYEAIVHSGDILSDPRNPIIGSYAENQLKECKTYINDIKKWINNKPFLFTLGNHDWVDAIAFEELLKENGIEAYCLHEKITSFNNINFYGLPFIPPINGRFAYETCYDDMVKHIDKMVAEIENNYIDVIVAHCPIAGCLDYDYRQRKAFGNTAMATALDYKLNPDLMPSFYLTGHIHEAAGITLRGNMLVSNAAKTAHLLEV